MEFLDCDEPVDHKGNKTARDEAGHGCVRVSMYCKQKFHCFKFR